MKHFAMAAIAVLGMETAWGQTASVRGDQVVVDSQSHWEQWQFPQGTVEIEGGVISPHFVPKNSDATSDIVDHLMRNPPGGKDPADVTLADAFQAGTGLAAVANLFDNDETTYWEPAGDSPLGEWWFQVDLGRLVSAKQIVLKFVPPGEGDPFLQFVVLTSDGDERVKGILDFRQQFRTRRDHKEQRLFEIPLRPTRPNNDPDYEGEMVRFVQVVVTATDGDRGAGVSEEEYSGLSGDDRGAVDYYKTIPDGEVRISQATYEVISPERRGSVRHYRRERPRLAELEVISTGENLALGIRDRAGIALDFLGESIFGLIDGEFESLKNINAGPSGVRRPLFFDLNAGYWVDTFQAYFQDTQAPFGNFLVQTSDGSLAPDGSLAWTTQTTESGKPEGRSTDAYEITTFSPVIARYVQILYWSPHRGKYYVPRELQLYGEGYQPEVELITSDPVSLGDPKNLVSIEWDADTPPGTRVEIQTRTGNRLAEKYLYYNKAGVEVTEEAYRALGFFSKGDSAKIYVPGADWSGWSRPYVESGERITSPSPRSSLMMRVRLLSTDPYAAASLDAVRLNFVPPLAALLLGELAPTAVDEVGVEQNLSVFISIEGQEDAFDEILLVAPSSMALRFAELRVGRESEWNAVEPLADDRLQVIPSAPDSLRVRLADPVPPRSADLLELRFTSTLFTPGAALEAAVGSSAASGSWQRVDSGDATEVAPGSGMVLTGPIGGDRILSEIALSSPVFTPNGDGRNEEATFRFSVTNLTGKQRLELRFYDLSGRLVHRIVEERPEVSGEYSLSWNGEGAGGGKVAPGIYLVAIEIDADEEDAENAMAQRLVHVLY